eukprot:scaffold328_cov103-Isochrysis_galbana.AAC.1
MGLAKTRKQKGCLRGASSVVGAGAGAGRRSPNGLMGSSCRRFMARCHLLVSESALSEGTPPVGP